MNTRQSAPRLLIILTLVACLIPNLYAVEAVVADVQGKVGHGTSQKGPWKALKKGDKLSEKSFVRTSENSSAVLQIEGQAMVTIHELTQVYLKNIGQEKQTDKNLIMLLFGKVWAKVVKQENGQSNFSIHTPAAIAAVRGTEYFVESDPKTKNSTIGVWEGSVGVFAQKDKKREAGVVVNAGFVIEVVYNQPPSKTKLLQLQQARVLEKQQFDKQVSSLGLTNALGGAAVETAKLDEARTADARDTITEANKLVQARKKLAEDVPKLSRAIALLHKDTDFYPGAGKRKTSDKSTTLKCLFENDDGKGKPIENWAGPYLEGNGLDPWGEPYGVYQRSMGGKLRGIVIHSTGPNKSRGDNDDEESYVSLSKLAGLLE